MMPSIFDTDWLTQHHVQPLLAEHGAKCVGALVDVGCGQSPYRDLFPSVSSYLRFDVIAADSQVVIAPAHSLPLSDGCADLLLATQLLGDLPDPKRSFTEWARVLKPAGLLVVFETVAYPEHDLPHDYWRIMPRGIEILAANAGFELVSMKRIGGLFGRIALLINRHIIEKVRALRILAPLAAVATALLNMVASSLDRLVPMPAAATDYLAVFRKGVSASAG